MKLHYYSTGDGGFMRSLCVVVDSERPVSRTDTRWYKDMSESGRAINEFDEQNPQFAFANAAKNVTDEDLFTDYQTLISDIDIASEFLEEKGDIMKRYYDQNLIEREKKLKRDSDIFIVIHTGAKVSGFNLTEINYVAEGMITDESQVETLKKSFTFLEKRIEAEEKIKTYLRA